MSDNLIIPKITITFTEKISSETAAEIKRVEDYLNSLRQLQNAIDPQPKKRKYTKRKKALAPTLAQFPYQFTENIRPEVPIFQVKENFIPNQTSITNYEITGIKNIKKSRSRKKVV